MFSPWIEGLRSVALNVPDLARAEDFYTGVWRLTVVARHDGALYLRGTGSDHHLLALHAGAPTAVRAVTLRARSVQALHAVASACEAAGGRVQSPLAPLAEPGGGQGLTLHDPDGRLYQVVHGDERHADTASAADSPSRLAHAVLNAHDVPAAQRFVEQALGFVLADRTARMAFMNCNHDHHSLALADADNDALNHVAFVMPDIDAVMRGGGRMRDAGHPVEWGPGRHGPGNNAFNYFVGPFGEVIEYTAEVEQVDDNYRVRGPADWTWPPGRLDQWGVGTAPSDKLRVAQRAVRFLPSL